MKKLYLIEFVAALFIMAIVLSPIGGKAAPQGGAEVMGTAGPGAPDGPGPAGKGKGDKGKGGKGKAPPVAISQKEFLEIYDKDGDGKVSSEELLEELSK